MGGCGATCGINRERERERAAALAAIARAYPASVWRARRAHAAIALGYDAGAILALAGELEELLPVRAIYRPGDGAGCDWLYLLAGVHAPSLIEIADGAGEGSDDAPAADETYVRLGFSPLGPYVTLQEVVVRRAEADSDGVVLVEEPKLGVDDRRLQLIVKGLQGKLRAARASVLDMAFLVRPIAEVVPDPGGQAEFIAAYGQEPLLFSFLFDAAPPSATRARLVFRAGRSTTESR